MLKYKLNKILVILSVLLLVFNPFALANNEEANATNIDTSELISEDQSITDEQVSTENQTEEAEENMHEGDKFILGDKATIDYLIDGNAFIIANEVTITSQIGGDAFIIADTVNLEQGYIYSNAFIMANNIIINGTVYDLYSLSNNLNIKEIGYIYRDLHSASNNITIEGTVGRNAFVECATMSFSTQSEESSEVTSQGVIYGNLNYSASNELSFPDGSVSGEVKYTPKTTSDTTPDITLQDILLSLGMSLSLSIVVWLLMTWLAPKFKENVTKIITTKPFSTLGFGAISLLIIPIITIILLLFQLTSIVAIILFTLYIIALSVSTSILAIVVANIITQKLKSTNKLVELSLLIITSAIIWAFKLIPYLGTLLTFVCILLGFGLLLKQCLPSSLSKKEAIKPEEPNTNP